MGDYYYLSVPVKKHLEKFFLATEGEHIIIGKKSFLWTLIRPYIVYKVLSGHRFTDIQKSFPGKIKIRLPQSKVRMYGLQARVSSIAFINNVLNNYFAYELAFFVQTYLKADGRYKGYNLAIQEFCKEHNIIIDEDISLDALQKLEFRFRKKKKKTVPHLS